MFKKVLLPTDFSEKSNHAFEAVKQLKAAGLEKLIVMNCIDVREVETMTEMEGFSSLKYVELREEIRKNLRRKAGIKMAKVTKASIDFGIDTEERLVEGIPFKQILRIAEKDEVDMIVLGSTGKGLVKELFLGSTSEKVVREAKCPVLVVK